MFRLTDWQIEELQITQPGRGQAVQSENLSIRKFGNGWSGVVRPRPNIEAGAAGADMHAMEDAVVGGRDEAEEILVMQLLGDPREGPGQVRRLTEFEVTAPSVLGQYPKLRTGPFV